MKWSPCIIRAAPPSSTLSGWSILLNDAPRVRLLHQVEVVQRAHALHPVAWVSTAEQGAKKLLISQGVCMCAAFRRLWWQRLFSFLLPRALSYLTSSIFQCLLNNQSDSEQLDISHPLAHCRMGIDLHIKSYAPGSCDRDGGRWNKAVWLTVLL